MRWDDPQTVRLTIRPELINNGGLLSGVVTYALVDYCMGSTLWAQTSEQERIATISISINYIQTATEGEIVCRTSSTGATAHRGDPQRGPPRGRPPDGDRDRQLFDLPAAELQRATTTGVSSRGPSESPGSRSRSPALTPAAAPASRPT